MLPASRDFPRAITLRSQGDMFVVTTSRSWALLEMHALCPTLLHAGTTAVHEPGSTNSSTAGARTDSASLDVVRSLYGAVDGSRVSEALDPDTLRQRRGGSMACTLLCLQ